IEELRQRSVTEAWEREYVAQLVNEQVASANLDTGPSSVEIVNEQIALAKLDTGPSSVEMVQKEIIEELRQRSVTEAWEREYVAQLVNR
nr:hypothetical protein [Acidimicrobiia bacterium]